MIIIIDCTDILINIFNIIYRMYSCLIFNIIILIIIFINNNLIM